ncbi:MAG TPA: indole-3-glycerol phosphate synthase TrpC [Roseiflexaceae bacterium]|nr:indole-3-glycerol phosphate synthase TrpC [Roseiflexaceae bacterium]
MASTSILDTIIAHKRYEVAQRRAARPAAALIRAAAAAPPIRDFAAALRHPTHTTLIAEVKKASPSRGVLIEQFDPLALAQIYAANGAAAISVLTDERFFQGSLDYLMQIRGEQAGRPAAPPLLRKDFLIDPYQVYEARAAGADALLLIVAALDDASLNSLLRLTEDFGMQALVEVHDTHELERALAAGATIIGVNNRNLHTFVTTLETTELIAAQLPATNRPLLISESGIHSPADLARVRACGADAVLVGESLVTSGDIGVQVRLLAGEAGQ